VRQNRTFILATALACVCAGAIHAAPDPPEILVSRQLLEARDLSVGDVVSLSASRSGADPRPFRVAGIYEPTPDPMRLTSKHWGVRLHLPDMLALTADPDDPLALESVSRINVALEDPGDAPQLIHDLYARTPGLYATPAAEQDDTVFVVLERFHFAIAIVTVLGSTAFLLALMVMRADERRETVGILRLVGLTRGRILLSVLVEGLCVAFAGALFGVLFAIAMEDVFNAFFQWYYDTALVFVRVTPGIAARCVALAVPLGVLAGLIASWTLLRREIVALLRR
jgi:predicted lysophospholipase L1 biosynthesis ABC-type transport system permease subunit